jgi:hypothetical protein
MATATQIPVSQYIDTSYHPDREYIDGELRERNVGIWPHSRIQAVLAGWLGKHELQWNVLGFIALRVSVTPTRIRVPDLVITRPGPVPSCSAPAPALQSCAAA